MNQDELNIILKKHKLWLDTNGAEGERAYLRGVCLYKADLREANLRYADLYKADLRYANLREACLYKADLREADLREADLREADLRVACLYKADLREACLYLANLSFITGKEITTFQHNRSFAYYCDGIIKIGCMSLTPKEWVEQYKEIGVKEGYTDEEIEAYGAFIDMIYKRSVK